MFLLLRTALSFLVHIYCAIHRTVKLSLAASYTRLDDNARPPSCHGVAMPCYTGLQSHLACFPSQQNSCHFNVLVLTHF